MRQTFQHTFISSLPLIGIILIVIFFIAPFSDPFDYIRLGVGYLGVVIGQSLFLIGLTQSILPIGKAMGQSLHLLKKMAFILIVGLTFGLLSTVAEPALTVFARQTHLLIHYVHETLFIWIMALGIGLFVALALYRILKQISIKWFFALAYTGLFGLILFVPEEFVALAFDGSGATTGDISVPFILALGLGVAATLSKEVNEDDIFGIIGIASIGPILTIFIYGIILRYLHGGVPDVGVYNPGDASTNLFYVMASNVSNVTFAILPLLIVFFPFQLFLLKLPKKQLLSLLLGMIPVFFGLLIFLTGIDFGFAFTGMYIGKVFLNPVRPEWFRWLLLPIGFILGTAITLTEPAVTVLGEQLEKITHGRVKSLMIRITLAIGIGFATVLAITNILLQISILWMLAPLYGLALILMIFTPKLFVGLAFDSGGVTGGALTSAMLTPLTLGIAQAVAMEGIQLGGVSQSVLTNGFGIIAFISVTPLIAVQLFSLFTKKLG